MKINKQLLSVGALILTASMLGLYAFLAETIEVEIPYCERTQSIQKDVGTTTKAELSNLFNISRHDAWLGTCCVYFNRDYPDVFKATDCKIDFGNCNNKDCLMVRK